MARDFVLEKFQTHTEYLSFVFILVQISSHSLVLSLLRADQGSAKAFPQLLWQSMTVFPPETRFQGQNSYCLQRSQCFPWYPNCNSPKGLPVPTALGSKSQCRPAPPVFQLPHALGMRLNQYKTKTVLSLPVKGGGTFPEKAALYSSQDINVRFCIHSGKAPQAQLTYKKLTEERLWKYWVVLIMTAKKF